MYLWLIEGHLTFFFLNGKQEHINLKPFNGIGIGIVNEHDVGLLLLTFEKGTRTTFKLMRYVTDTITQPFPYIAALLFSLLLLLH